MNAKTNPTKRGQDILAQIGQIPIIVQGKLSERRQGGRVTGIKLQRWRNGRNETRHVPADLVETVRQGTRGYAHFMALAREYVEHREAEVWGDGADSKKKSPRGRRCMGAGVPSLRRCGGRNAASQGTR